MHLVFGATGVLGSRVVRGLLAEGLPVRAVSRSRARLAPLEAAGAEGVQADLLDPPTVEAALSGATTLILAAHGLVPPSRRNHPGVVDGEGARRAIDAAKAAGVGRVIHLSVARADQGATAFSRVKASTEAHLVGSGLPHTILRPSLFMENHALVLLGEPLREGRKVDFFGGGSRPLNWVSADDVARWVVEAALDPGAPSEVLEVGGPETLTRLEALVLLEVALARHAETRHLPLPVVRALRWTVGALSPGMGYLLDLVLAEETGRIGPPPTPETLDRVGTTRLADVVEAWAREGPGSSAFPGRPEDAPT